jgi:2-isopropylmalate synthase
MARRKRQIALLDTTLRDGCQAEGVSLTLKDKLQIAARLDEFGIDYIEGGYPLSNPKDREFFVEVPKLGLKTARVTAFGSTRRKGVKPADDRGLKALLKAETPAVTIVGKAWDLHVRDVLRATPAENLKMIEDTVAWMKRHDREVIFDAEHFFDGCKANEEYALKCLKAAANGGADWIVLCDTNGGSLTSEIQRMVRAAKRAVKVPLGIHAHNDSDLAVANSVAAVEAGAMQVQGTMNGLGERCGNADLVTILAVIALKLGRSCRAAESIERLTELSRYVYEMANMLPRGNQPFVGDSAFAHKGGLHIDAMRKNPRTYEHVDPAAVGNERRFLVSELSGHSLILDKAAKFEELEDKEVMRRIRDDLTRLEAAGYQFEAAEASFELIILRALGRYRRFFKLEGYHVDVLKSSRGRLVTDATVKLNIGGNRVHTAAEGDGPVNALDGALRKALEAQFPTLREMQLVDYRVRVINPKEATAARVRVIIQSRDERDVWGTIGVDENVIEASWKALVDSIEYKLLKDEDGR